MNTLFENRVSTSEAIEEARQLNRKIAGKKFSVLLIANHINKNFADYEHFREKMTKLFVDDENLLFSCLSSRFIKILLFDTNKEELLSKADQVAVTLYSKLSNAESKLVIAVGNPVERISEIQQSYQTAKNLLDYSLIQTHHQILYYQSFGMKMNQYEKEIDLKKKIDQITTQTLHLLIDELIEKAEKSENTLLYRLALLNELNQLVEEKNKKVKIKFPIATPSNLSAIISDSTLFRNYLNQVLDFLKRTVIDESMRQYRDLIEQAILYIKQNFSDPELTLGDVASIQISAAHILVLFFHNLWERPLLNI
ncbi:hypothetical protein ABW365_00405 [Enterococcus avium]